jgi:hypothetical protein
MSVTQKPMRDKPSAIITRAQLDRQRGAFERFSAFGLLFFSFAGTVAALSGGWTALRNEPHLAPIVGGIALQLALTAAEYWYGAGRGPWRYRIALCIDSALTTIGYGPLFVPWLTTWLAGHNLGEMAAPGAWLIVAIAAFALAWWPEKTLID